ncbi:holin [Mycobacterium phage Zenteno07]|nr:holin [Mycobacterium phage Zenteno07]
MSYNFGEIRKTAAAAGGLLATGIAYVIADETLRDLLPPQVVVVLGAIGTIWGVFRAPDDRVADPKKPAQAIQVALDSLAKARAKVEADRQAVAAQDAQLAEAVSAIAPVGTTPFSLPAPTDVPTSVVDVDSALIASFR